MIRVTKQAVTAQPLGSGTGGDVLSVGKSLDIIYKTTGDYMAALGTPTVNSTGGE